LASQIKPALFRKIQISMNVSLNAEPFSVGDINLDEYREIIPKKLLVVYCYYLNIDELDLIYE
jgi:hypothetical protein